MTDRIVGEYGRTLRINVTEASLAAATLVEILVTRPTGVKVIWIPDTIVSGGGDNYVTYRYRDGDLDYPGDYTVSVRITYSPTSRTETEPFTLEVAESNWGVIPGGDTDATPPEDATYELWVDVTEGDDANPGTEAEPLATVGAAAARLEARLLQDGGPHADMAVYIAAGDYAEDVVLSLPCAPRRRILFQGPTTGMTVLTSGTLTAASSTAFTDAGATFGTGNQYAGSLLRLTPPGGASRYVTIRDHGATTLRPCFELYGDPPAAGWGYAILAAAVTIRNFRAFLPWKGTLVAPITGAPLLVLHHLDIGPPASGTNGALEVTGGAVQIVGVRSRGDPTTAAYYFDGACVVTTGPYTIGVADPLFGLPATDYWTYYNEGLSATGSFVNVRMNNAAELSGVVVARGDGTGEGIFLIDGTVTVQGGALIGLTNGFTTQSPQSSFFFAATAALPPLLRDCARGFQVYRHGYAEIQDVEMQVIREEGFHVRHMAALKLYGPLTASAADLPTGIHVRAAGCVELGASVQIPHGGNQPILCDELVSTSEAIFYHVPLLGDGSSLVTRVEGYDISLTGVLDIYVDAADPDATDLGAGLVGQPFVTCQAAADWVVRYLRRGVLVDRDIAVHIAAGHYAEQVDMVLPCPPKRRLAFFGDPDMTIVASGSVGAGSTVRQIEDLSKSWTEDQWKGRALRLRSSGGTSLGLKMIRGNTATALRLCGQFWESTPAVGMTYEVLEPATLIDSFRAALPWSKDSHNFGSNWDHTYQLPQLDLAYLQFGPWDPSPIIGNHALHINGGATVLTACRLLDGVLRAENASIAAGDVWSTNGADPLYGVPEGWDPLDVGIWCGNSSIFAVESMLHFFSAVFDDTTCYGINNCYMSLAGGALYGASSIYPHSNGTLVIGVAVGGSYSDPVLLKGISGAYAIRSKARSEVGIDGAELVGPFAGPAFYVDQHANMSLGSQITATGTIPVGIYATRGAQVLAAIGLSFSATQELMADAVPGTFAGIDIAPLVGATAARIGRDTA